ncbi:ComF family protein [Pinirhizobacter soli]|uniref:ComF family protein n=1 Tax=Pinirhizobacter soli TaxID=2786953 RepID=UPI00202AB067|nr:ComF family protein [Pinirhizobacter soli]
MHVNLKEVSGPWTAGWVLDKHTLRSEFSGNNEWGHPTFNTIRTEIGEATFLLKNRADWTKVKPLAEALANNIYPKLKDVGFIVPMPASTMRHRQPVTELAQALGAIVGKPVFEQLLLKAPSDVHLKDLNTKAEKLEAIGNGFSVHDKINNEGAWNVLLVDDLFHTGASMEAACKALKTYPKVHNIYVAALTWRPA